MPVIVEDEDVEGVGVHPAVLAPNDEPVLRCLRADENSLEAADRRIEIPSWTGELPPSLTSAAIPILIPLGLHLRSDDRHAVRVPLSAAKRQRRKVNNPPR